MITGNKGEWSELYVFLRLLGDGGIYGADEDLNKIRDLFYPLIEIHRDNNIYKNVDDKQIIRVIDGRTSSIIIELDVKEFNDKANTLLRRIKNEKSTFNVDEVERFMEQIKAYTLKASSTDKSDITVILHDAITAQNRLFKFSIKSQLGSSSTLLNAGKTTNFVYQINGCLDDAEINKINEISTQSKVKDRIFKLYQNNKSLTFIETESDVFYYNLQIIDSKLPEILAYVLIYYYQGRASSISELTDILTRENPCCFSIRQNVNFYKYKIKRLLREIALGMMPSKQWNGELDATGGYIIVKESGDIVCYHIYNINQFEDYLFNNTKLETASSSRHEFGTIYKQDGKNKIKLNLQIRFNK